MALPATRRSRSRGSIFVSRGLAALGIATALLVVFVPRNTRADEDDEVSDSDRGGEWDEQADGPKYGDIVLKGELKSTPAGWVLVRTAENVSDQPASCTVEERLTSATAADGSRVSPMPTTLILRTQKFALKPHEKKSIGVPVPAAISTRMDAAAKIEASVAYESKLEADDPDHHPYNFSIHSQTHDVFGVDYLTQLPPGKKASAYNGAPIGASQLMAPAPRRRGKKMAANSDDF